MGGVDSEVDDERLFVKEFINNLIGLHTMAYSNSAALTVDTFVCRRTGLSERTFSMLFNVGYRYSPFNDDESKHVLSRL